MDKRTYLAERHLDIDARIARAFICLYSVTEMSEKIVLLDGRGFEDK